jgi:dihydrofolate reductase
MSGSRLGMIWAQAQNGVIGIGGVMPWHVPEDMAHFKQLTLGHPVIMGRRTWESIPPRFRPLDGRRNIVITSDPSRVDAPAEVAPDPAAALALAAGTEAWVIGGGRLYAELLPHADVLEVTEIAGDFDGDTFAPELGDEWAVTAETPWAVSRGGAQYRFLTYRARAGEPLTQRSSDRLSH